MSVQANITGLSGDDLLFNVSLTYNGAPLNLGTITSVTAYLKPYAVSLDALAKVYTVGTGLTIVSSLGGTLTWLIPHADVPGNNWYRFTVLDTTNHLATAIYGRLEIQSV